MDSFTKAVLRIIYDHKTDISTSQIYSALVSGKYLTLQEHHLKRTIYGGRPAYQHQVRGYLSNMVQKGLIDRLVQGVYRITESGKRAMAIYTGATKLSAFGEISVVESTSLPQQSPTIESIATTFATDRTEYYNENGIIKEDYHSSDNAILRSPKDNLSLQPDKTTINRSPIFYTHTLEEDISPCNLNKDTLENLETLITQSGLSVRASNVLLNNFSSLEELACCDPVKLFSLKNCGKITAFEILYFINHLRETGLIEPLADILATNSDSITRRDVFSLQPDKTTINLLPVFNPHAVEDISVSDLHPDFRPYTELSDIAFSARTKHIFDVMGLKIIGEVMCTSQQMFMKQQNFGRKCLYEIHKTIEQVVFENLLGDSLANNLSNDPGLTPDLLARSISYPNSDNIQKEFSIDYSSYETMVDKFVKSAIKTDRQQKIIFDRLCFQSSTVPTLEALGKKYDITRERARQIIKKATAVLIIKNNFIRLARFWDTAENLIRIGGGVIHLDVLAAALNKEFKWPHMPNPLAIGQLLSLWLPNHKFKETSAVIEIDCECLSCDRPLKTIHSFDFESSESFHIKVAGRKLFNDCQQNCAHWTEQISTFHDAFLEKVVSSSGARLIIKDGLLYPYEKWSIKYGESLEDAIKVVLKNNERPMHYSEIAIEVKKMSSVFEGMVDHNIHASLSRYQSVELVARGTFALKEWALERYRSVSDAIEELLKASYYPLRREQIIKQLKNEFSEGNITASLTERTTRFVAIGEGFYDCHDRWLQRTWQDFMKGLPEALHEFVTYLVTNNNCSYKPVLALVFIRGMDDDSSMPISTLQERFYNFYSARHNKGLIVEKDEVAASKIYILDPCEFKNRTLKNPMISFLNSGFFKKNGAYIKLQIDTLFNFSIKQMKDIIIIILLKSINDYFSPIGTPLEEAYNIKPQDSKAIYGVADAPSDLEFSYEQSNENTAEISIKKIKRVKIKL